MNMDIKHDEQHGGLQVSTWRVQVLLSGIAFIGDWGQRTVAIQLDVPVALREEEQRGEGSSCVFKAARFVSEEGVFVQVDVGDTVDLSDLTSHQVEQSFAKHDLKCAGPRANAAVTLANPSSLTKTRVGAVAANALANALRVHVCVSVFLSDVWRRGFCSATQMNNRKEDMEISSHYRQLLRELNEQRQHGILCDACVIVDGKIFKAHKNVLLGSSRYFKTLYCQVKKGAEPHHQTTVTHLDIVTATGFKAILDFMYSAHLALTSKNVIEVMSAASYLQMTDIVQACHSFIKAALDISIRSEMAEELADFEMGAVAAAGIGGGGGGGGGLGIAGAGGGVGTGLGGGGGVGGGGGGGIVGMASEALASIMSGRSTSPWLARRTSPANSSGDSAIASCHEGGSMYGKEDQEPPKSHESQEEACHDSQPAWPHDYRPVTVKEEQVSPASSSHPRDTPRGAAQSQGEQGAGGASGGGGEGPWQPLSGSGRRKNRKNKDTVRHITQQAETNWDRERDRERERDSRPGSPLPSMLAVAGWNYNGQEIPGKADKFASYRVCNRGQEGVMRSCAALLSNGFLMREPESQREAGRGAVLRSAGGHVPSVDARVQGMLGKVFRGHSFFQCTDEWREMGVRGADVTEPNSSDSRGERLDFFLKQEEPLTTEPSYLGPNESEEAGGGGVGGTISSVANLKAALMSKNSLLSLRAEMMGDDNPLLFEYLPKGAHSLS
ncbi:hypothetical protein FQN60_001890, partial [Etheostoma spectabile]